MGFWDAVASAGLYANNLQLRQITTPTPHHSIFYRPDAILDAQPTVSKHKKTKSTYIRVLQYYSHELNSATLHTHKDTTL